MSSTPRKNATDQVPEAPPARGPQPASPLPGDVPEAAHPPETAPEADRRVDEPPHPPAAETGEEIERARQEEIADHVTGQHEDPLRKSPKPPPGTRA